jgi:hypothetical protein
MKKLFVLPVATIVALGACSDVVSVAGPEGPNFQLVLCLLCLFVATLHLDTTCRYEERVANLLRCSRKRTVPNIQ